MWHCVKCREMLEDTFDVCWNCGTSKDGIEDRNFRKDADACAIAEMEAATEENAEMSTAGTVDSKCAKCGGAMEEGFVRDVLQGGCTPATWVEGQPEWSFWSGTKTSGKEQFRLQAFRCAKCGLVELYARKPAL